jgi:aerobic-type carbon monoxide dehydrogenase small subunit (CoxS/CutS family)
MGDDFRVQNSELTSQGSQLRARSSRLIVNGREIVGTAPGHYTLLRWLRDVAGVYDVKYGCGEGVCGACTVLVDVGRPASGEYPDYRAVSSCLVLAARLDGASIQTVSGLLQAGGSDSGRGELNDLQQAFLDHGAAQCGFCTPGMLMAATELLALGEPLDEQRIREGLHGNLCRCTGYGPIVAAVQAVAVARSQKGHP